MSITFIADPKNGRRVFDPESGYALTRIYRDVPKGEEWFDFLFEGTTFEVKASFSWSDDGSKGTYVLQVKQLGDSFRHSPSRREPAHKPSPQEFRATVLPTLRDALVAQHRRTSGDPRIVGERMRVVDVDFIDHAMADGSNIR